MSCPSRLHCLAIAVIASTAAPALAVPSTATGKISVEQVRQMLEKAPSDRIARQLLTAYLAGVGETASAVVDLAGIACRAAPGLDTTAVRRAIGAQKNGGQIAATPLIVRDMLVRAGCRR